MSSYPRPAKRVRATLTTVTSGLIALGLVLSPVRAAAAPGSAKAPAFTVVASGLANPRALTFGSNGTLFVAEAGLGAGTPQTGVQVGTGHTGTIRAIQDLRSLHPEVSTIVSGLWSETALGHGFETTGVAGISARGETLSAVMDGGTDPQSGKLLKIGRDGRIKTAADVSAANLAWEAQQDPKLNPDFPDTNPYGVLVTNHRTFVVDAASNTLDEVGRGGAVRVIAYFPNTPNSDAVPTCVTKGPDGALYVGTLAIADGPGGANVYRVDPDTKESVFDAGNHLWASGLSAINGCAFSPDGKYFYASEFIAFELLPPGPPPSGPPPGPPPGAVIKIPFANPASHTPLAVGLLTFPGGVAVGRDGSVYVANFSNNPFPMPLLGQVVRLTGR